MHDNNDQRTDKELEVESYLSQFDSEENSKDDDNDISSFLLDDPDKSDDRPKNTEKASIDLEDLKEDVPSDLSDSFESAIDSEFENISGGYENGLDSEDAKAGAAFVDALLASEKGEISTDSDDKKTDGHETIQETIDKSDDSDADKFGGDAFVSADGDADNEASADSTSVDNTPNNDDIDDMNERNSDSEIESSKAESPSEPQEKKSFWDRFRNKEDKKEPSLTDDSITAEEADGDEKSGEIQVLESIGDGEDLNSEDPTISIDDFSATAKDSEEAKDDSSNHVPEPEDAVVAASKSDTESSEESAPDKKHFGKHKKPDAKEKKLRKKRRRRIRDFFSFFVANPNYDPLQGEYIVKNGKKKKNKERKFSFFHFFRDCFLLGCLCVLIFISYAFVIITKAPKIDPTNIYNNVQESSVIYNDNGKAVDSAYYTQDRKLAKYEDMPENLINAFVALEDKTFWKHHGFNWTRMIGAVLQSFTGSGKISGTSTITQQLARNVYLPDTMSIRSIKRKILEMYYAAIIERKLTKQEIVEAYLNTIYLGFGAYGVETASEAYFGKSVSKLSLEQCAALAALPQAPNDYALVQKLDAGETPDSNDTIIKNGSTKYVANDESKDRRETCLALMKQQGYITEDQYNKAVKKKLTSILDPELSNTSSVYSYFHEYLIEQVIQDLMDKYDYSESKATDLVYTGGLKIYSTVDSKAQKVIVKEFKNDSNFPSIASYNTNSDGNIINSSGSVMLYKYSNFFNKKKEFTLSKNECTINEDGSLTIKSGHRLNIYNTSAGYSLEFKPTYTTKNGKLYMYSGGYINIPSTYESMDDNDNLVISADFFKKYPNWIKLGKKTATITEDAYTLPEKTIQPQAAMVIVEVGTGKVKAMVGGRKQSGEHLYNRALNPRQSGSSIKPISVYSGALQKSYELASKGKKFSYTNTGHDSQGTKYYGDYLTASSIIIDEKMTFNGQTWPQNSTNSFSGAVTMRKALQQSINVCAVKLELQLGADYVADLVEKFGITTLVRDGGTNDLNPAALALGGLTNGVIPLEMAQAYAAFPNGGVRQSSIAYTKVTDRNGKVLLESKSESTKVLDEGVAFIMTDMLKSVVSQGIGSPASISGVQSGGKTGTTSSEYDIWFDGFTPSYAASLWIGNDVNMQLTSMSGPAASLWGKIMNQIPKAKSGHYKSQPSNVTYVSGEYYTKGTESGRSTYYAEQAAKRKAAAAAKKKAAEAKKKAAEEEKKNAADNSDNDDDDND